MTADATSAIYGSYNARSVDSRLVAERFVAPPQFWDVVPEGNSVLSGPRGSGKTTLLKMLEARALEHWDDPEADRARTAVTYSGVFVPADRSWSGQVTALAEHFDPSLRTALGLASFSLHALRALSACAAIRITSSEADHPHGRVTMARDVEEGIVRAVWSHWGLSEPVGTFRGLRFALSDLLLDLGKLARRARRDPEARARLSAHSALDLDPVEAMIPFIERFNAFVGQESHVWMFLIDEIEFLPPLIRGDILKLMRGRDPRIMQKVSLAPYTAVSEEDDPLGGWVGHDYQRIDLTFPDKEKGYEFNADLVKADLKGRGVAQSPEQLFGGIGAFESTAGVDAYGPEATNTAHIAQLAEKDESFRGWLERHGIKSDDLGSVVGVERAATIRKAMPIILLRDEFLHLVDGKLQGRSRKNPQTYLGAHSVYAICEGNPRLLKALVSRLITLFLADRLDDAQRAEVISDACREYELHLRALTLPPDLPDELMPRRLVRRIGEHFEAQVLGGEFNPEPVLSFDVAMADIKGTGLGGVVAQLVHYGAFVPISDRRFRLAHMFAPTFHLPLRKGRAHSLRRILGRGHGQQMVIPDGEGEQ